MATAGYAALRQTKGNFNTVTGRDDWRGSSPTCPPQWLLDKIADESMTGGWDVKPSNICGVCHTAKTVTGRCYC